VWNGELKWKLIPQNIINGKTVDVTNSPSMKSPSV
jgi:hypothetical protein